MHSPRGARRTCAAGRCRAGHRRRSLNPLTPKVVVGGGWGERNKGSFGLAKCPVQLKAGPPYGNRRGHSSRYVPNRPYPAEGARAAAGRLVGRLCEGITSVNSSIRRMTLRLTIWRRELAPGLPGKLGPPVAPGDWTGSSRTACAASARTAPATPTAAGGAGDKKSEGGRIPPVGSNSLLGERGGDMISATSYAGRSDSPVTAGGISATDWAGC